MTRHDLTPAQAQLLADIATRKDVVEREWFMALTLVGLDPARVRGGNLTAEDPHLMMEDDAVSS